MSTKRVMAMNEEGQLTYCTVPPDQRGVGRCNHVSHQREGQSVEEFIQEVNNQVAVESTVEMDKSPAEDMPQEEIDQYASRIDEIAGTKVTIDNFEEVMSNLPPEKVQEITKIGFDTAPEFSLPITDEDYDKEDEDNNFYFSSLPQHGIAGKATAIQQMFDKVGTVPGPNGQEIEIEGNYRDGLTPDEYFNKMFSARQASIAKTVSVAKPGYISRKLFYALSDMEMKEDCGGPYVSSLKCKVPGSVCYKCASKDGITHIKPGTMMGSIISTNISEPGTQLEMREFHSILYKQKVLIMSRSN